MTGEFFSFENQRIKEKGIATLDNGILTIEN